MEFILVAGTCAVGALVFGFLVSSFFLVLFVLDHTYNMIQKLLAFIMSVLNWVESLNNFNLNKSIRIFQLLLICDSF